MYVPMAQEAKQRDTCFPGRGACMWLFNCNLFYIYLSGDKELRQQRS